MSMSPKFLQRKNMPWVVCFLLVLFVLTGLLACSNNEEGFRSTHKEYMKEFEKELRTADVPFRKEKDGFIWYQKSDSLEVKKIKERVYRRIHSGTAVNFKNPEANAYFRSLLDSLGLEYRVEARKDGEWINWYPTNEAQSKKLHLKVVEWQFEKARELAEKTPCTDNTLIETHSRSEVSRGSTAQETPRSC